MRLLVIFCSLHTVTCTLAYGQEPYFSLNSNEIFASGSQPYFNLTASHVPSLEIRVYRIHDPAAFFTSQKDLHSPIAENSPQYKKTVLTARESTSGFLKVLHKRYRTVFRMLTKQSTRENLVSAYDISKQKTFVMAASFPVLKEHTLIKSFVYKTKKKKQNDDYYNYEKVSLPVKVKGVYLIEGIYKNLVAYTAVLVSDIRFIAKETASQQLVFVVKRATGEPVEGVDVVFVEKYSKEDKKTAEKKRESVTVKTDKQGIARLIKNGRKTFNFLVKKDADFLLNEPYSYSSGWDKYKVYIYTDRPVYRPGHTVHFKALLRGRKENDYDAVKAHDARVKIMDTRDNVLYEKTLTTNDWGSLEGEIDLPDEPPLGRYSIEVSPGEDLTYYGSFQVEEYRKPEYKVTAQMEKKNYVSGDTVSVSTEARYYFGEPVKDAKISYFVYRSPYDEPWWLGSEYEWYFAGDEGYYYYDFQLLDKGEGTLDENGKFSFKFQTKGQGQDSMYKVVAKVEDKSHRSVEGSAFVKVAMGTFRITLDRDRTVYTKGDTVRLSVNTKDILGNPVSKRMKIKVKQEDWAYVSEKDKQGKLIRWKWVKNENVIVVKSVKTKKSGHATVSIPVRANGSYSFLAYATDERGNRVEKTTWAYVTDSRYSFYSDTKDIELTADKTIYHINDTAKVLATLPAQNTHLFVTLEGEELYEVRVVDVPKQSVTLELPMKNEYAPNVYMKVQFVLNGKFYEGVKDLVVPPDNQFLQVDVRTDKQEYQPGENVHLRISVKDASGNPVSAEVSAGIVDESIYAIHEELAPDIRQFFYGHRWNLVDTQYSYDFYFSGYSVAKEAKLKKAMENKINWADVKGKKETKIRKKFLDTMYWNAVLRTNKNGVAEADVPCPDNLTTWRVTARAATLDSKVGQAVKTFITRKDLLIRLVLPRFFRERDTFTFQTIVHNYLESDKNVQVRLETDGLDVKESLAREIPVKKGKDVALSWNARVTSTKNVVLRAWAETNEESDAMEMTLPVLPHGIKKIQSAYANAGEKQWEKEFALDFPDNAIKNTRRVKILLSPSLMGSMYASLDYLIQYPYGCTEQTMSSFLPAVVVNDMVKELSIPISAELQKKIPDVVYRGMNRLYDYQHGDGGWGWWQNDETDTEMTAYVMLGLSLAKKAGVKVKEDMFENGVSKLYELLQNEKLNLSTRLYLLYALSLSGKVEASQIRKIYDERASWKKTNAYGLSLMALILHSRKLEKEAKDVAGVILSKAVNEGNFTYWEGKNENYWWEDDTIEMTAYALRAVVNALPDDPHIPKIVAFLLAKQKGAQWKSTRDTSLALLAFVDYLRHTGELSADFNAEVNLNGKQLKNVSFTGEDVYKKGVEIVLEANDLKQRNALEIVKNGKGMLYANIVKEYYTDEENIAPAGKTFSVSREYFLLKPRRQEEEWVYKPQAMKTMSAKVGDEILVKLTVKSAKERDYFMLEDFLPAGCEVLKSMKGYRIDGYEYDDPESYEWSYFWSEQETRDEKVSFFVTYFPKGAHTFTYIMRPEMPGNFHVMPAEGSLMYFPEAFSTSAENILSIGE